jgi:hypothetical protein
MKLLFSPKGACAVILRPVRVCPEGATEVRLRVRTNRRVEVPSGREHWPVRS